jgi:hypothetical protein
MFELSKKLEQKERGNAKIFNKHAIIVNFLIIAILVCQGLQLCLASFMWLVFESCSIMKWGLFELNSIAEILLLNF